MAAALTAVCIIMLKQSPSFGTPSQVSSWFNIYFFNFPLYSAVVPAICSLYNVSYQKIILSVYHVDILLTLIIEVLLFFLTTFLRQLLCRNVYFLGLQEQSYQDPMPFFLKIHSCLLLAQFNQAVNLIMDVLFSLCIWLISSSLLHDEKLQLLLLYMKTWNHTCTPVVSVGMAVFQLYNFSTSDIFFHF